MASHKQKLQQQQKQQPQQNINRIVQKVEEPGFESSCCDYNSDVFKEQPSYALDEDLSLIHRSNNQLMNDLISLADSPSHIDLRLNHGGGSAMGSHSCNPNSKMNSGYKLRIAPSPNMLGSETKVIMNGRFGIDNQSGKTSCEQSLHKQQITPQQRTNYNGSQKSYKNQKQPLYSMVPQQINKNVNSNNSEQSQPTRQSEPKNVQNYPKVQGIQQDPKKKALNYNNYVYCEESEIMKTADARIALVYQTQNQNSVLSLTPQKKMPMPMSPQSRPVLTNCSNSGYLSRDNFPKIHNLNQLQRSSEKNLHSSESKQKATIVSYNEFKYMASGNECVGDPKKYVDISHSGFGLPKNSLPNNQIPKDPSQYELSPGNNCMFDVSSPKTSMSNGQTVLNSNSLRNQIILNSVQGPNPDPNYQLMLKSDSFPASDLASQLQPLSTQKIQELQQYIQQLESDLKQSQDKNAELKRRFKDRSFIQSFEKSKKHLSDTEDSLILSEKKGKKRNSISKGTNSHQVSLSNHQQSTSSIVDVKIRPINSLKGMSSGASPGKKLQLSNQKAVCKKVNLSQDENIEYQVQDYNDIGRQDDSTNHNCSSSDTPVPSDECEQCERLKQLVFQAKEAIDDLKLEIDEWRTLCAEKDKEIRQVYHKVWNDIMGKAQRQNVEFASENQTKEFDVNKPVNADAKKIRNFINHNKTRIRSRSKTSGQSPVPAQFKSIQKKSSMKTQVRDIVTSDEFELYQAEDQGIQTSFLIGSDELINESHITNSNNNLKQPTGHFTSNQSTAVQLSPGSGHIQTSHQDQLILQDEIVQNLKTQNQMQEQEIQRLRLQLQSAVKQCEGFTTLVHRVKRKSKKSQNNIDIDEIKQSCEIGSGIESYSILEKINEWKREEGLLQACSDLPQTQIPRPLKLISDIDPADIQTYEYQKNPNPISANGLMSGQQQLAVGNKELMQLIKNEQENLRLQTDLKYQMLHKQQQDYLNLLKAI